MTGKYTIEISTKRVKYSLVVKRNITIVQGDSATGKSKLIEAVDLLNRYGASSGYNISCDKKCVAVSGPYWKETIHNLSDTIIFIDEYDSFIISEEFAKTVRHSDNYFVLVTREHLPQLPYSVHEIYELRTSKHYSTARQVYTEMVPVYPNDSQLELPDLVITEDSNSGFEFFEYVFKKYDVICKSAEGKTRIFSELKNISSDTKTIIIVDGAAFGAEIQQVYEYISLHRNLVLYTPESFEWLLLASGVVNDIPTDWYMATWNYADSKEYFSWEQFYTEIMVSKSKGTPYRYSKSKLNTFYLSTTIVQKVMGIIPLNIEMEYKDEDI